MEIIHVVLGKANPARMNGVNKVVNQLATRQSLAGEKVTLWGITGNKRHDYPERPYATMLFRCRRNPFRLDRDLVKALDGKKGNAIFHLHGGFIPTFFTLGRELHRRDIPFVLTAHGSYNEIAMQRSHRRKRIYFRLFERHLLEWSSAVHCLGKSELQGLSTVFPNNKSVLIPYGFEPATTMAGKSSDEKFIIGFCGRLDTYTKGLDVLMMAFAAFTRLYQECELWIIGDGPGRIDLEAMALRLGVAGQTVFYGSRFDEDKMALLRQLDLFAHPSRNEGLPTAVLEAASLGIPCLVTEATNVGESVRDFDCGVVIDQAEEGLACRAIQDIYHRMHNGDTGRLRENARRMITEGFNWRGILTRFHQLYNMA